MTADRPSNTNARESTIRKLTVGGALVLGVFLLGVGAAMYAGVDPMTDSPGDGEPITDFPTATPDDAGSGAEGSPEPFSFTIDRVEECGRTCREVTVTLHNNRNATATGITVYTRIYAGENNTADDDVVWEGRRDVGTLDAGASRTTTERVELSLQEGLRIERRDGWITIVTTVESDQSVVTFRDSQQVA